MGPHRRRLCRQRPSCGQRGWRPKLRSVSLRGGGAVSLGACPGLALSRLSLVGSQAWLALGDEDQTAASERTDEGDERANQRLAQLHPQASAPELLSAILSHV